MDNRSSERREKNYTLMRRIYDFTMATLILGLAVVLLFGKKWNIEQIVLMDDLLRGLMIGICFLYGGFRVYRGIKAEY